MILVTGGAGFIGSSIAAALAAMGREVVALDDLSGGDPENLAPGVRLVEADVSDPAVAGLIGNLRPRAVVHAAAQVSVAASAADPAADRAVNVEGTANVIRGARSGGAQRLVFLSSGGAVYGESRGASERSLPRPASYYGAHKYLAERYVELSGLPYAIARLSNVYGPGQRSDLEGGVVSIFLERLRNGVPVTIHGSGDQRRDFVHVEDVVSAILAMIQSPLDGTWNVGTGASTSIVELLRAIERELGITSEVDHGPRRPGDVRDSCLSVRALEHDLGWRASYDLAAGVSRTVLMQRSGRPHRTPIEP